MSEDPDGRAAGLGQQTGHQVQAESSHLLTIHLHYLISSSKQAGVQLLCTAVQYILHVHTGVGPSSASADQEAERSIWRPAELQQQRPVRENLRHFSYRPNAAGTPDILHT